MLREKLRVPLKAAWRNNDATLCYKARSFSKLVAEQSGYSPVNWIGRQLDDPSVSLDLAAKVETTFKQAGDQCWTLSSRIA